MKGVPLTDVVQRIGGVHIVPLQRASVESEARVDVHRVQLAARSFVYLLQMRDVQQEHVRSLHNLARLAVVQSGVSRGVDHHSLTDHPTKNMYVNSNMKTDNVNSSFCYRQIHDWRPAIFASALPPQMK